MAGVTSNPRISIQLTPDNQPQTIAGRRDLIIGQLASGATATGGALNTNIQNLSESSIRSLFGAKAALVYKIIEFLKGNDKYSQLDVIGIDNSGGTAATASIAVTGTATAAGEIEISVVDEVRFTVTISVASGAANTVVSAAIDTALSALTNPPFSSSESAGTVTITAADKGTIGNTYGIKIVGTVPGITTTITGWAGGATNPTLTTVLDVIDGIRYTGLQWPEEYFSNISIPVTEFDSRFNFENAIMDGVIFTGHTDTYANDLSSVTSLNSQSLVVIGNNKIDDTLEKGTAIMQPADWVASYFMGVRSKRLTEGALVSDDVLSTASGDVVGGIGNASLPYFNSNLPDVPVTSPANLFSDPEQQGLEDEGFSTFGVNESSTGMIMGQVVTTFKTDDAGNPNTSFKFLNYVDTGSVCREYIFNNLKSDFGQSRLTEGDLIPNRSMANPGSIKSKLEEYYKYLSTQALVQAGSTAEKYFKDNTTVTVDLASGLAAIAGPLPVVTRLRSVIYTLKLSFSITS